MKIEVCWPVQKSKITDGVRRNFYVKSENAGGQNSYKLPPCFQNCPHKNRKSPETAGAISIAVSLVMKRKGGLQEGVAHLASLFGGIAVFTHGWAVNRGSSPLRKKIDVQNRSADSEQGVWRSALVDWIINCLRVYPCWNFFRATNQGVKKKAGVALNCIAMTKPQGKQIIGSMIWNLG